MWIRKIGTSNRALIVGLPVQVAQAFGWRRGDHLQLSVVGEGTVVMQKVPEEKLTDKIIAAAKPEAIITHE
jgi:bifunctional DNA-binding transcriptional regulator/antitoxin component of YhaV-PrlF toxin-antitoxin module